MTFLVIRESFLIATVELASTLRATYGVGIRVGAVGDYPRPSMYGCRDRLLFATHKGTLRPILPWLTPFTPNVGGATAKRNLQRLKALVESGPA